MCYNVPQLCSWAINRTKLSNYTKLDKMEKAEQILEKNINGDDLHFIFHEKKELWRELINAINEALRQPPVIESVCSCSKGKGIDHDEDGKAYCIDCGNYLG